jgi:hypothetical protein
MMDPQPHPHHLPQTKAGVAAAEDGQVILDGPNGVAVAMTPEAAQETARSLLSAAEEAAHQRDAEARPS